MSPIDDRFISGGMDDTIRFWDLRTNVCQGILRRKGVPSVAFDPQGLVVAIATAVNVVKLYDVRDLEKGPFSTFHLEHNAPVQWAGMKFSNDEKLILLWTEKCVVFVIDAFSGGKLFEFTTVQNESTLGPAPPQMEASFTPDSQYIIAGAADGNIQVWSATLGTKICEWSGHAGPVNCVQWNPKTCMAVSSDQNGILAFWLPDPKKYLNKEGIKATERPYVHVQPNINSHDNEGSVSDEPHWLSNRTQAGERIDGDA